jgi:hypothetical protein
MINWGQRDKRNQNFRDRKLLMIATLCLWVLVFAAIPIHAQSSDKTDLVNPRKVLLKSLILPGWGHLSLGGEHRARGKWQLGTEVALWLSYAGFKIRSHQLENNLITQASTYAGIDIEGRDQDLWIALGRYSDLDAYNQQQLLNRNWNNLYEDTPDNRWSWQSDDARSDFQSTRNVWNRTKQQLPAVISAMLINRIIASISAYRRARAMNDENKETQAALNTVSPLNTQQVSVHFSVRPTYETIPSTVNMGWPVQPVVKINF